MNSKLKDLIEKGWARRIRIHSVLSVPLEGHFSRPFYRVAFEFLDPPGPWSMQFYEARGGQDEVVQQLESGTEALFFETKDEARLRVLTTADKTPLLPR